MVPIDDLQDVLRTGLGKFQSLGRTDSVKCELAHRRIAASHLQLSGGRLPVHRALLSKYTCSERHQRAKVEAVDAVESASSQGESPSGELHLGISWLPRSQLPRI